MATDVNKTLRKVLTNLEREWAKIDRQIVAIRNALAVAEAGGVRGRQAATPRKPKGTPVMSAAARKAVSRRMKAYWAKRKAEAARTKGAGTK
jgi:hypothetical protein